jgi:hypothetical protein
MSDWFDEGGSGTPVDVQAIWDSDRLHEVLARMVQAGALISMGTTSDGGALGLTVTVDGKWRREYFRDGEAMLDWLMGAEPHILRACEAKSASSDRRRRVRSR